MITMTKFHENEFFLLKISTKHDPSTGPFDQNHNEQLIEISNWQTNMKMTSVERVRDK